ncbi:unnamed protein product [Cunninghamella echinulata]
MAGFLRPSDITCINTDENQIDYKGILHLLIVAPKEKRRGQPTAYKHFMNLVKDIPCYTPHPSLRNIKIHSLFRHVNDLHKPLSTDRVSRYIQMVMKKVGKEEDASIPKARALAATLAALANISVDDIVSHGSWSSKDIFKHFYHISSGSSSNITQGTLNKQLISQQAKCNIM